MRSLFIFFLLLLLCPCLRAQDYIYSVTMGTSWAREVFPRQERLCASSADMSARQSHGMPSFAQIFTGLEQNYRQFNTYNDSIFFPLSHGAWIDMFKRRAKCYSGLYATNNEALTQFRDYLAEDHVPEAAYDSVYYWARHLFFHNINDIFVFEELMDVLLPHYEAKKDVEHLVFCYLCAGMYNYQCSRMGDRSAELRAQSYFEKIMELKDRFSSFRDPLNRYYLISAFVNLTVLHTQSGTVTLNEGSTMASMMRLLYNQPQSQEVLRGDSLLNEYAKWSLDIFRYRGIMTYISRGYHSDALLNGLYQSYADVRRELGVRPHSNRYYAKLEYDDCLVEAYMGNISWDEAFSRFEALLYDEPEFRITKGVPNIKINYLYNIFETFVTLLEKTSFPEARKRAIVKERLDVLLNMISRYDHNRYAFEKGKILANIACEPAVVNRLTVEEKEDLLYRLIVLEQPTTYVHVKMVTDLSRILAEGMIDQHPDFFVGVPGYHTVEDVAKGRDQLLAYVEKAAIFHDLGKISMPSIINNCTRRLSSHEYDIIRLHPEKSLKFFAIDPLLQQYQDIALGHHKWYNGEGYPASYKNRKSPYFPIISIVSLCDCMDAGTENIGRNYHTPRSFESVMDEFRQSAGEQYHPVLVDLIDSDEEIYQKMKLAVNVGRYDNYYKLYQQYMVDFVAR